MKLGACRHCGATLMQGALGCLGCGRLVDEHEQVDTAAQAQTQLGTGVRDSLLDSRWRLVQPLGRGKKAITWLAHDVPFDRKVVVKLLDEALLTRPDEMARFEKNAKRLAGLEHKNVVAVLALGRHQGTPFVAMRRAEGRSLAEHLHARGGRLPPNEAAFIVAQLADAFEAVHQQGSPQGGLQPRSVFVVPEDARVTLLDVRAEAEPAGADATEATARVTERLEWVAPEVIRGGAASVRSDLFTLGCVAWELVCGAPPHRGPLQTLVATGGTAVPPPQPQGVTLAAELRAAIVRATQSDPGQRFGTASELRDALAAAAAQFRATMPAPVLARSSGVVAADASVQRTQNLLDGVAPIGRRPTGEQPVVPVPREADTTPNRALERPPDITPSAPRPALARPPHLQESDASVAPALDDAFGENVTRTKTLNPRELLERRDALSPERRRRRRNATVAAGFLCLMVLGLWLALAWDRSPEGPAAPVAMARIAVPGVAPLPEPPPPPKEPSVDDVTAPVAVQVRREVFEREYTDEAGKGARRARVKPRVRPPLVADYFGVDKYGELQVLVLYGGQSVIADVSIDGQLIGPSPVFRPLKPGPHVISLERRPLEPVKVPVTVVNGKSVRLEIELIPLD